MLPSESSPTSEEEAQGALLATWTQTRLNPPALRSRSIRIFQSLKLSLSPFPLPRTRPRVPCDSTIGVSHHLLPFPGNPGMCAGLWPGCFSHPLPPSPCCSHYLPGISSLSFAFPRLHWLHADLLPSCFCSPSSGLEDSNRRQVLTLVSPSIKGAILQAPSV